LTAAEQRARRRAVKRAARRANSSVDDSDSDGAFAAEASDDARSPAASPGGSRADSQTTATTALVRPLLTPPRTSCPTATLLRALLFTGLLCCDFASVHCSCCTTVACVHLPQPQPHLMHVPPVSLVGSHPAGESSRMQRCRPTAAHGCQSAASVLARRRASGGRDRGRLAWHP
jgi:hypothetical protein